MAAPGSASFLSLTQPAQYQRRGWAVGSSTRGKRFSDTPALTYLSRRIPADGIESRGLMVVDLHQLPNARHAVTVIRFPTRALLEIVMAKAAVLDSAMQKTHEWLKQVGDELGFDNEHAAYAALRATLHALRDRLPLELVAHFGAE